MLISIDHTTLYEYDQPARYGVQEFRMTPASGKSQKVHSWEIEAPGIAGAGQFVDAWGNHAQLVNQLSETSRMTIRVRGIVETAETGGVVGSLANEPPPRIFLRETPLTKADEAIRKLAEKVRKYDDEVARCHALMGELRSAMRFETATTHAHTTAAEALRDKSGVCQDFSHVFISACRLLGQPARYVTGYLLMEGGNLVHEAHHAWAEAEIRGLGWVGFDAANAICPDARYVRLASAPDASLAAPLRGLRRGAGSEKLTVSVSVVEQAQQ